MERGTTLDDPVDVDQRPNLRGSNHEISEYLKDQCAYDLFSYLLKELLTQQPEDPLQHMLKCLQTEYPLGPLKVIVASPPCIGRSRLAKRLAEHFGLEYIGAGELIREGAVKTTGFGYADQAAVAELVMHRVQQAAEAMRGFVLDGFPRTRFQTSFLKERSVVPTHVLVLKVGVEQIRERQQLLAQGILQCEGEEPVTLEALEQKLRLHSCHSSSALETYRDKMSIIEMVMDEGGDEKAFQQLESRVRTLPRSRGPHPPPRVLVLGPRGIGVQEHASRLAMRLGAVFVDASEFPQDPDTGLPRPRTPVARRINKRPSWPILLTRNSSAMTRSSSPVAKVSSRLRTLTRSDTSMEIREKELESYGKNDKLGAVGVRLRHPDCTKQGWVMCGFPTSEHFARILSDDSHLLPTRVVALQAEAETCIRRLQNILTDGVTGKVWTSVPKNENIRKRLQRKPEDHPNAVSEAHMEHNRNIGPILDCLNTHGQCTEIDANGALETVHSAIVEFVERPLPLPPRA